MDMRHSIYSKTFNVDYRSFVFFVDYLLILDALSLMIGGRYLDVL